jgi:hypothetical protein
LKIPGAANDLTAKVRSVTNLTNAQAISVRMGRKRINPSNNNLVKVRSLFLDALYLHTCERKSLDYRIYRVRRGQKIFQPVQ